MRKEVDVIMRTWTLRAGVTLLVGTLCGALAGCGHDPNHDIDREKARAAARRVHPLPKPGEVIGPDKGG